MVHVFRTVHDWRRMVTYAYSAPYERDRIEVPIRTPGLLVGITHTYRDDEFVVWCQVLFPQGVGWVLKEWLSRL